MRRTNAKAVIISKGRIARTLKTRPEKGVRLLEPFKSFARANNLPINILEDRAVRGQMEVHRTEADLWLCLEGKPSFTVGGKRVVLHPGDWLWIPPGVAHAHAAAKTARLAIVKIPAEQ